MKNKTSAFTLIELSAVIVIIGILIAGIMTATGLVKKSKIAAAQSLTKASPINGIQNNDLWLESSQESSFKESESSTGDAVTTWYDQKNSVNKSSIIAVGTGPTYSNTINYIHAVKFNGSATNYLQLADASFLNNNNYTIFVVEKRQSSNSNNYFLGDSTQTSTNQGLLLGYSSDGSVIHSQSGTTLTNASTASVDSYANYNDKPRIFTFNFDTTSGSKTYINGTLSGQNTTNLNPLTNVTSLSIGKGYSGEIGEIAVFSRSLKSDERKAIEDYLSKKWSVKMTRESAASCTSGIVTENGCKQACPVSVVGVSRTSAPDGFSGSLTCDATGYAGGTTTQTYTCSNGSLTPTPSSTVCSTSGATTGGSNGANVCASGYAVASDGTCKQGCTFFGINGIVNNTSVSTTSATTQIACNAPNYNTAKSVSYTCIGASLSVSANGCSDVSANDNCLGNYSGAACSTCKEGYTLASGCASCDTANGYQLVNGACVPPKASCTGGTESTITVSIVTYKLHKFTSSETLTCTSGGIVEALVVAGGGAGSPGNNSAGGAGGGAGGVLYSNSLLISATSYPVTVGAGGTPKTTNTGVNYTDSSSDGKDSSFSTLVAKGGGAGGVREYLGRPGGSGGGGGIAGSTKSGGQGTSGQGYNGGSNNKEASAGFGAGGGGGAGGVGEKPTMGGGNGGPGILNAIYGTDTYYGGGGASSCICNTIYGTAGIGGGGAVGVAGTANTGGGGGGAVSPNTFGGAGGSGIVIVRYAN